MHSKCKASVHLGESEKRALVTQSAVTHEVTVVTKSAERDIVEAPVLAKIDQGRLALYEARSLADVKRIADIASAMETYSRRQKLGEEAERYARELRLDAERKLGEILRDTPKNAGGRPTETGTTTEPVSTPTLAAL